MIEESRRGGTGWSAADLSALAASLVEVTADPGLTADCLSQVEALEALKAAAAAAQARVTAEYADRERARLARVRGGSRRRGREPAVGSQLGIARRESPARGEFLVGAASALVHDLPGTLAALERGVLTEERALLVVRETDDLSAEDRLRVDVELWHGPSSGCAATLGTDQLRQHVRRLVTGADPVAATRRRARARAGRHVAGRLLGDGTGRITAVVRSEHYGPVMQALTEAAAEARAAGDPRTPDQVRSDVVVRRLTGVDPVEPRRIDLRLVLGLDSLLGTADAPGLVPGSGHLPAAVCRSLLAEAFERHEVTVRRLFALPEDGQLVAMEKTSRCFDGLLAEMIRIRDAETCRTPWCDASIRHLDHVVPAREDGRTSYENGQGLCERCNHVKETPGWTSWVGFRGGGPEIGTRTSSGRCAYGKPPPMPVPGSL
ncbi:HNH endonuclease [Nocardioides solisilvae]|uniref:HNH endonuclease n=1 Tax=Nocardioides solisilvae TaxID=1542435 RepID=UPI000D74FF01|nr:HNH endonuclease [Nocardioides solisilvae]